jgi:hypothetical protein
VTATVEMFSPELTVIAVDPDDTRTVNEPLMRISLEGGCDLPACNCSPEPFVLISDGTTCFSVRIPPRDVERIRNGDRYEAYLVEADDE